MTILTFIFLFLTGEIPTIVFPFAMLCDTVLIVVGLLTGVIHR